MLVVVDRYKFNPKHNRVERIAHFLDYCADKLPYQPVPPNLILKAIMGYGKKPRLGSEEVDAVSNAAARARRLLLEKYHRPLIVVRGEGMRAGVDSTDNAKHSLRKAVVRLDSARNSIERERAVVNAGQLDASTRAWVMDGVDHALKTLKVDDRIFALLPAANGAAKPPGGK